MHRMSNKLEPGTDVEVKLDWNRRFDHMQQHTGQHLISAIAINEFQFKTLSWCLTDAPRECYIEFDTEDIKDEQWVAFERAINTAIRNALAVKVHVFNSLDEAKKSDLLVRSKGLPANLSGPLRLIEISDKDFNTCCGTHLKNTAEIQVVSLVRKEKARKHTLVYFLAGNRAIEAMSRMSTTQISLNKVLSCGPDLHVSTVNTTMANLKASNKLREKYIRELATLVAPTLLTSAAASKLKVAALLREDGGAPFMNAVVDQLHGKDNKANVAAQELTVFLADQETGQFVLSGPGSAVHGPKVAKLLDGRGGGKGKYQGKTNTGSITPDQFKKVVAYLETQPDS